MEDDLKNFMVSATWDVEFEAQKWIHLIPFIAFPSGWMVKPLPPFAGAVSRFQVKLPNTEETVSVYLDCYDNLGYFGEPYWEVYPLHGDTGRCAMNDTEELIRMIGDRSPGETT